MADRAALLADEVLLNNPMRQWVLSVPFPLRFLFASQPAVMGKVSGIAYRAIAADLRRRSGYTRLAAHTGAVTLIQRFGSALNLNIHFHMLFLDGLYVTGTGHPLRFHWVKHPPAMNWHTSPIPSPGVLPVTWNAKGCWSAIARAPGSSRQ